MVLPCVNTCDSDVSGLPGNRSASTLAHCLEMKQGRLRYVAALNGCKVRGMHMTKVQLLKYIEHKLDEGGRLIVPDNTSRSSWLAGAMKKRPKSKDVVKRMDAEGKNIIQIRAALKLLGFTACMISARATELYRARSSRFYRSRTKHMDRPRSNSVAINACPPNTTSAKSASEATPGSASFQGLVANDHDVSSEPRKPRPTLADLRKMNIKELRKFAVSVRVYVSSWRFGMLIKRPKAEILQDIVRQLGFGDCSTHASSTQCNGDFQGVSGDVSVPSFAQCRSMYIPCVRKRPASALGSKCLTGASQRILSGKVVSRFAEFREMNINKLRHVAGFNGVRTCLGKSDGCGPRKRTKAEMLEDIERKLEEVGSLLVPSSSSQFTIVSRGTRPIAKDVVANQEGNGNTRIRIRAALKLNAVNDDYVRTATRHLYPSSAESATTSACTATSASKTPGSASAIASAVARTEKGRTNSDESCAESACPP